MLTPEELQEIQERIEAHQAEIATLEASEPTKKSHQDIKVSSLRYQRKAIEELQKALAEDAAERREAEKAQKQEQEKAAQLEAERKAREAAAEARRKAEAEAAEARRKAEAERQEAAQLAAEQKRLAAIRQKEQAAQMRKLAAEKTAKEAEEKLAREARVTLVGHTVTKGESEKIEAVRFFLDIPPLPDGGRLAVELIPNQPE